MAAPRWIPVARFADLPENDVVGARALDRPIAVYRVDGEVFASDDRCTHGDARLSEGFMIDHCIECPLHQGQFDVRTGQPICEPVTEPIRTYPVRLVDGMVEIDVGGEA